MSYARVDMSQGQVYRNVCRMIASSPKHNGYSLFAAEYLLKSLLAMPEGEELGRARVNWLEALKREFPADYWNVTSKVRKTDSPKAVTDSARTTYRYLKEQQADKKYLTFRGRRFQVSHIAVGIAFIVANVPPGNWEQFPLAQRVYDGLKDGKKQVAFVYRGGVAKFEVER